MAVYRFAEVLMSVAGLRPFCLYHMCITPGIVHEDNLGSGVLPILLSYFFFLGGGGDSMFQLNLSVLNCIRFCTGLQTDGQTCLTHNILSSCIQC